MLPQQPVSPLAHLKLPVLQLFIDFTISHSQFISAPWMNMPGNRAPVTSFCKAAMLAFRARLRRNVYRLLKNPSFKLIFCTGSAAKCMPRGLTTAAKHAPLPYENGNRPVFRSEAQNYLACRKIVFCVCKGFWTNKSGSTIKNAVRLISFCISRSIL